MAETVQIKERPILMNARSVKGILNWQKTQTRRIVKFADEIIFEEVSEDAHGYQCVVDGEVGHYCIWKGDGYGALREM